jgi:hypothetical protein
MTPAKVPERALWLAYWCLLGVVALAAAELTSRCDDWATDRLAFLANPSPNDLKDQDSTGVVRGAPHGRLRRLKLNAFGFRNEEIERAPSPGITRIIVLGASEIFCSHAPTERTIPGFLEHELNHEVHAYEVINASIAGITLNSMIPYYTHWVSGFSPQVVVVYANPLFYLHDPPPNEETPDAEPSLPERQRLRFESRLVSRLRDIITYPNFYQAWRTRRAIAAHTAGKPDAWYFTDPPPDRLQSFNADLLTLADAIRSSGATPILVTHAIRATTPPRAADAFDLQEMRFFLPRATAGAICQFHDVAKQSTAQQATDHGIPVVDVAQSLDGQRECFIDLVHFSEAGAQRVAHLLADAIRDLGDPSPSSEPVPPVHRLEE